MAGVEKFGGYKYRSKKSILGGWGIKYVDWSTDWCDSKLSDSKPMITEVLYTCYSESTQVSFLTAPRELIFELVVEVFDF